MQVRCQASETTAIVVVRDMLREGLSPSLLLRKLYAGALGAAVCSIIVGAVHYASYEAARRASMRLVCPGCKDEGSSGTHGGSGAPPASVSGTAGRKPHHAGADAQGLAAVTGESHRSGSGGVGASSSGSTGCGTTGAGDAPLPSQGQKAAATFLAAAFAATATALVEAPVELFRHNAQAGLLGSSNFLAEMARTARREGLPGLYWGFLPHCFEAIPHDVGELIVYGACRDFQASSTRPGSGSRLAGVPVEAWDVATGAASGAAAVLVSMPLDTVKVYLQTRRLESAAPASSLHWPALRPAPHRGPLAWPTWAGSCRCCCCWRAWINGINGGGGIWWSQVARGPAACVICTPAACLGGRRDCHAPVPARRIPSRPLPSPRLPQTAWTWTGAC